MWMPKGGDEEKKEGNGLVAVAVDKDKSSQYALKWAIDNLLNKGQTVTLIHVKQKVPSGPPSHDTIQSPLRPQHEAVMKEVFLPFRCFCSRKEDIVLEDLDIAKAVTEYVSHCGIDNLVVGAASRSAFLRTFKPADVPTNVTRTAPDFCTVYVISKGKVSSVKTASRAPPSVSRARMHNQDRNMQSQDRNMQSQDRNMQSQDRNMQNVQSQDRNMQNVQNQDRNYMYNKDRNLMHNQDTLKPASAEANFTRHSNPKAAITPFEPRFHDDSEPIKSPFSRGGGRGLNDRSYGELSVPDTDISFVSSGRPSTERMFPSLYDNFDPGRTPPRLSNSSDKESRRSFESSRMGPRSVELQYMSDFSMVSQDSSRMSSCSSNMEDVEAEMKRLRLELRQTMDMYSSACKEALSAKQKAVELHRWKMGEEQRMQEARLAEEAALAIVQKEKAKCKAAIEAAEAAQRLAELEAQKRMKVEMMAFKDAEEKKVALSSLAQSDVRYRRYTIEEIEVATECFAESRKIGEGGYGPVYKCYLDHTPVAVKVLRPDAAQGRSQFQQEVEVLSCIRHPNMVLLLGACPEYGCLVYEYMANGSLDDCLFTQGNNPVLSWQLRFRIAAEIATGLLFLHQTKPEPLVHRDLKPGNILLDRNYVSKISDVGLARLVPPSVANTVTQYRMTSTAGTFCYIDPEYQQTGMLGIKSDVYSLGIMLLQIITAKPPMGLTHHVERAIEKGQFAEMLDPAVTDWPVEEALGFAKLALQCAELRRKDRPDLGNVVLPELNRLRDLADDNMHHIMLGSTGGGYSSASSHSHFSSMPQEIMSDPLYLQSGYDSSKSRTSVASLR